MSTIAPDAKIPSTLSSRPRQPRCHPRGLSGGDPVHRGAAPAPPELFDREGPDPLHPPPPWRSSRDTRTAPARTLDVRLEIVDPNDAHPPYPPNLGG